MDPAKYVEIAFGLIGGLGIFLLGMKNMSEGMQAVAGNSLRRMIGAVTNNRFMATGVGTAVTCLVQSSSITTVLVVGSVNSGVMTLSQAIGVIMGANIGTTITGWILVLKIGKYGLPLLGVAAFIYLFVKGDRWRYWAMFFMGVGMVFFGLETMKGACSGIKDLPQFEAWFHQFTAENYLGVLKCALVGCVLTMIVQSSSATLGITISLAAQGVIPYETAAALVLGENIGTTVTAYFASLGATTNARRAAYFHMIFNVCGVLWITAIFPWYTDFILTISDSHVVRMILAEGKEAGVTASIALTHSVFNITNTLLFLPFLPLFVRLLEWLVPAKKFKEKPHLTDLDIRMLETPLLAIEQSRNEILKMGEGCEKMMGWLQTLLSQQQQHDRALVDKLQRRESVLDSMHDEVADFITNLLSANIPHAVAEEARGQLRMADEYESISDYIASVLKFDKKLRKDGFSFSQKQRDGLAELHGLATAYLHTLNEANRQQNPEIQIKLEAPSRQIRDKIKQLRREHLNDLSTESISPNASVAFMAALNSYARVRDHAQNIAEVISGEK